MYIVCLKQYRVMYLIKQCSMMYMSMSLNNVYTVMYAIKKQDARAFKYMSEATINTSYFGCQLLLLLLFFFFFWGGNCSSWVGIVRLGWELSVLGGNCPYWVGIIRLG